MFGIKAAKKWEAYPFLTFLGTLRSNLHLTSVCSIEITRLSRETGLVKSRAYFYKMVRREGTGKRISRNKKPAGIKKPKETRQVLRPDYLRRQTQMPKLESNMRFCVGESFKHRNFVVSSDSIKVT